MKENILIYLLVAFIAYNLFFNKEGFAITYGATSGDVYVNSKAGINPSYSYLVGTWNGNTTKTEAQFGGSNTCSTTSTVPRTIYKLIPPVNATCKVSGDENIADYTFTTTPTIGSSL